MSSEWVAVSSSRLVAGRMQAQQRSRPLIASNETVYERSGKNMFWPIKNLVKYLVN